MRYSFSILTASGLSAGGRVIPACSVGRAFLLAVTFSAVAILSACAENSDAEKPAAENQQPEISDAAKPAAESQQAEILDAEKPQPVSFSAQTDEGVFNSAQHKGDVIYLDFWASWCGPCRESFPWMNEMLAKHKDKGLQIIGVSLDHDKNLARRFADEFKAEFTIGYDVNGSIADQFGVKGLPSSVIIDREGNLFEFHTGFNETQAEEFESGLVKALN